MLHVAWNARSEVEVFFIYLMRMANGVEATWSKEESLKLIDVWGQGTIQKQFQDCKRNQATYI